MTPENTLENITLLMVIKEIDLKRLKNNMGDSANEFYKNAWYEATDKFGNARSAKTPLEFIEITWHKIDYVKNVINAYLRND